MSPQCFSESLLSYSVTGCKIDVALRDVTSPAGSYTTMLNWHESQSAYPANPTTGATVSVFDIDQILSKNYRIRHDSKMSCSAITTVIGISASDDVSLQKRTDLSPHRWCSPVQTGLRVDPEKIECMLKEHEKVAMNLFQKSQYDILNKFLFIVKEELQWTS